jgi:uncharacterized membrane protein
MTEDYKWSGIGFLIIILLIVFMAWKGADMRQTCRVEAMKANRSAEDIVKICP